jgi:hypothetical protein
MGERDTSPFSLYLNTNYVPSDSEVTFLKRLIQHRESAVASLAKEIEEAKETLITQIDEAKSALVALERQFAIDRHFIEEHTMLLSPIRRIPQDVLTLLFHTLVETVERPGFPQLWTLCPPAVRPPVIISQVCIGWRRLALQTPTLWTHIHCPIPYLTRDHDQGTWVKWCKNMEARCRQIEMWIYRSSPCPIDMCLQVDWMQAMETTQGEYREVASKLHAAIFDKLFLTTHRWHSVLLDWGIQDTSESVLKIFDGHRFPILRKANFYIDTTERDRPEHQARVGKLSRSTVFATATLRDVTLAGWWPNISVAKASSSSLLYESITHFSFQAAPADSDLKFDSIQALDVLKSLPNLVRAQVRLSAPCPPFRPLSPPIHLLHLVSMVLKGRPVSKGFAPSLYLPRLEYLHLDCRPRYGRSQVELPDANGHEELLLQEGSKLRELMLFHDTLSRESLPRCLRVLLNLTILKLYVVHSQSVRDDRPHVHLLSQLSIPGVLPRLEELQLHNMSNKYDAPLESAVADFVAQRVQKTGNGVGDSRRSVGRSALLRRVQIRFAFRQGVDIVGVLRSRGASLDGIDLSLRYPLPPAA